MKKKFLFLISFLIIIFLAYSLLRRLFLTPKPIKIGIIHSLTGDLEISEKPVAYATLLAIKEINDAGGILGRPLEALLVDGKSDDTVFAQEAERLIIQEKVAVIFGGWTSPSRIKIKEVVERHNILFFYPVQFEGLEASENIVYTSTTPNQQIIPGVTWCLRNLGKRFFLIGSDHILHEIIKDVIYAHNGEIVGIEYLALEDKNVESAIEKIIAAKPDVILNNIEGFTNLLFFTGLRKRGITPEKIPTMSFSISEPELQLFNTNSMTGDYATWSYFETIDSYENKQFKKKIKALYGEDQALSDSMEAAHFGVYLWKQAVEKAHSIETNAVRNALYNQAFNASQGLIHVAESVLQIWSWVRIGKIRSNKQFNILWSSDKSVFPMAYPATRSVPEWNHLRALITEMELRND